jgi:hypothetical protein
MMLVFAGVFLVTAPFCVLLAWSHNRYIRKRSGFVELDGDILHYFEKEHESPAYSEPFEECLWFEGARTWATLPNDDKLCQIVVGPRVILLQFPEWCASPNRGPAKRPLPSSPSSLRLDRRRMPANNGRPRSIVTELRAIRRAINAVCLRFPQDFSLFGYCLEPCLAFGPD